MVLADGDVTLRPIKLRDQRAWREVNRRNRDWLRPWEATIPPPAPWGPVIHRPTYRQMVRHLRAEANAGRMLPFVIEYQGRLVGQLTVAGITWGSMCAAHVGYWVDRDVAGRGSCPRRSRSPSTTASGRSDCTGSRCASARRTCRAGGSWRSWVSARRVRPRYLHIDGAWRDHLVFALTVEEVPEGLVRRWHRNRKPHSPQA